MTQTISNEEHVGPKFISSEQLYITQQKNPQANKYQQKHKPKHKEISVLLFKTKTKNQEEKPNQTNKHTKTKRKEWEDSILVCFPIQKYLCLFLLFAAWSNSLWNRLGANVDSLNIQRDVCPCLLNKNTINHLTSGRKEAACSFSNK